MSELKAPGPGRNFEGCPKACGTILFRMAIFVVIISAILYWS